MNTYREISYMCIDLLKSIADDSYYTVDHILYLVDKYRAFLLKKTYIDAKKEIPESNYQTVTLNLEEINGIPNDPCSEHYLRSIEEIPELINIVKPRVSTIDFLDNNIAYINQARMSMVGHNKWLKNIIYCTIGADNKLYLKSANPQAYYLKKATISGIFESPAEVSNLTEGTICDVLDRTFPLEEALIPSLIELVVKEISGSLYHPVDDKNNADDDLSKVAQKQEK